MHSLHADNDVALLHSRPRTTPVLCPLTAMKWTPLPTILQSPLSSSSPFSATPLFGRHPDDLDALADYFFSVHFCKIRRLHCFPTESGKHGLFDDNIQNDLSCQRGLWKWTPSPTIPWMKVNFALLWLCMMWLVATRAVLHVSCALL